MNSELSKRISSLADSEDVEGMTQLLLDWPERDAEWLLFVDVRIAAPSSSKKQKDQLKKIKSAALIENPSLEDDELVSLPSIAQAPASRVQILRIKSLRLPPKIRTILKS